MRPNSNLYDLVDLHLKIQKLRVGRELRFIHLVGLNEYNQMKKDLPSKQKLRKALLEIVEEKEPVTVYIYKTLLAMEDKLSKEIKDIASSHPAWPWLKNVKGCGEESTMKLIGLIEKMRGRKEITKKEYERLKKSKEAEVFKKDGRYYKYTDEYGFEVFSTVSKLWKYLGLHTVNGKAPKREKGKKVDWNQKARSLCWRIATNLIRAKGVYYEYYKEKKNAYMERFKGRVVRAKKGQKIARDYITLKHLDNMARRKLMKLWTSHLWEVTRQGMGLPVRPPYVLEHQSGHHYIAPMTDRE